MEIDRATLFDLLRTKFSRLEMQELSNRLGVNFDELDATSYFGKIVELIAYMERSEKLDLLVFEIKKLWPDIIEQDLYPSILIEPDPANRKVETETKELNIELANLRQRLGDIQKNGSIDKQLESRFKDVLEIANRAVGRSQELTARVLLPRPEDMNVQLVPSHSLDRLEEYRSDENVVYLLIGTFTGAILGILSNWATSDTFIMTRVSIVLMAIFFILITICSLWIFRISRRVTRVKEQILHPQAVENNIEEQFTT